MSGCSASLLACNYVGTGFEEHLLGEILNLRLAWKVNSEDSHFQEQQTGDSYGDSYRDSVSQGFKVRVTKTCIFLAAVATPAAHFCCTGTAWEVQRERAQGAALAGKQRGLELFLPICSLGACMAVAAQQQQEEEGEQEGWEPEQSQPLQYGQEGGPRGIRGLRSALHRYFQS